MRLPKVLPVWKKGEDGTYSHYEEQGEMQELVAAPRDTFCTSTRIYYSLVVLMLAVVVPVTIYYLVVSSNVDYKSELWTCTVKVEYRIPCPNATFKMNEDKCMKLGCCWDDDKTCFHSVPSQHSYRVENLDNNTAMTELETKYLKLTPRISKCLYDDSTPVNLGTRVVSTSEGLILRLYLYDITTNAPDVKNPTPLNSSKFSVEVYGPEYFSLQINRREEGTPPLFSTSLGPTIACDDYWELALKFPKNAAVFGLGALRLSSKPKVLYNSGHRLGANPFIMILDTEGRAHGILFKNRGPMEFQLLENSNVLSVKSRSRVMWDISVFAGPNPVEVMKQYTSIDELRPTLPRAWTLGFHICRDTERNNGTLVADDAKYFLKNAADDLPYETECLQEGLLYGLDFSISENMTDIIEGLRNTGRKLLLSLPPHVEYSLAKPEDLFVSNGTARLQEVFRGLNVSYPDFFNEKWQGSFSCNIRNLTNKAEDILGGFVLQDNWPASTTAHDSREDIPVAEGALSTGTLWWNYLHGKEPHYWVHNEYGLRHAKLVASCVTAKPELVLSAATHTGVGAVGGCHAHAQADVRATWSNMKTALETALGLGLVGIPLSGGGSVCGTAGEYDEELCIRWYQMSSMLPLMRVSSEGPLRDPANIPGEYSRQAVKNVLELRYSLLAYFYSLFHEANHKGVPVARPMFFEFPTDNRTWTIDQQFMIGPALMACPVFYKDEVTVPVYLPKEDTTWYHFIGGHKVNNVTGGLMVSITSLKKELVLLLRGGFIVPYQKANLTVDKTLAGSYNLVVGLRCREGDACSANGSLYRDSEDSQIDLNFTANETGLVINGSCFSSSCILKNVSVYGLRDPMISCTIVSPNNGAKCTVKEENGVIEISDLQLDLSNSDSCTIEWNIRIKELETEQPGTEDTETEQPGTEDPETEQPGTEDTETEQPGTEDTETEQPGTEDPETEQPGTEDPETEPDKVLSVKEKPNLKQ